MALQPIYREGNLLVTLSGGADSTALLHLLHRGNCRLTAVHCNFHLRGEESNRDQAFCVDLCKRLGVSLIVKEFDVPKYREERGVSVETACRELRYGFFRELMERDGFARIVTGHHADDNAETLFLNLMRGAGVKGLKGMVEDTGEIWRPLSGFSHAQILEYLRSIGEEHVEDSTNADIDFSRNFIRNQILPMLGERWPEALRNIGESQRHLASADAALENIVRKLAEKEFLERAELLELGEEVLHRYLQRRGFPANVAPEVWRALSDGVTGKRWHTETAVLNLDRDGLRISRGEASPNNLPALSISEIELNEENMRGIKSDRSQRSLYVPIGVGMSLKVRHPKIGDRIDSLGMKGSQLISDIVKDAKLNSVQKAELVVVADVEDRIVWVPGLKRSRHYLILSGEKLAEKVELFGQNKKNT